MHVIQANRSLHFLSCTQPAASGVFRVTRQRCCRGNPGSAEGPDASGRGNPSKPRAGLAGGVRESRALARAAWGRLQKRLRDAVGRCGSGLGALLMAAQQGIPTSALRVLEEALGLGLTDAGDTADAVAAEGAHYLERILSEQARPPSVGQRNGYWGRERGLPTGRRPRRLGAREPAETLVGSQGGGSATAVPW